MDFVYLGCLGNSVREVLAVHTRLQALQWQPLSVLILFLFLQLMRLPRAKLVALFLCGLFTVTGLTSILYAPKAVSQAPSCFETPAKADRLYKTGDKTGAEQLYRQCKRPPTQQRELISFFPTPITDPDQLSAGGKVYWREVQEGLAQNQPSRVAPALNLLIEKYPDFVPTYAAEAEFLKQTEKQEEALATLEKATTLFPSNADLAKARITALADAEQPLDASIAARLFAIANPYDPEHDEFIEIADKHFKIFKRGLRWEYSIKGIGGFLGNVFLGRGDALSNAIESRQLASLLFQGEEAMGEKLQATVIGDAESTNTFVTDELIVGYVNRIGQNIAKLMGRDEFTYEFHVINKDVVNAFAAPGGKVFVYTGAIMAANSEAELAGLLGHEVAHAVLSHGYQRIANNGLLQTVQQAFSLGALPHLASLGLGREQEKQSDILGARAISGLGYAADGARNFFVAVKAAEQGKPPEYLSSHPATDNRIQYLESLIQQNGYNRYGYEGVEEHLQVKNRISELNQA